MTGGTNRGLEDLLRDRLHEVDALEPPEPDFEFRALRAGRERIRRRRSWQRGLVGAAAAVTIGALAVPALGRLQVTGSGGAASSGVAAPQRNPEKSTAAADGSTPVGPDQPNSPAFPSPVPMGVVVPYRGSTPVDWSSSQGQAAIARVRAALSSPRHGAFYTAVSVDTSIDPARLVVHVTRFDVDTMLAAVAALPPDAPVAYTTSAFSAESCAATLTRVGSDRPILQQQGYAIGSTRCDDDGRVEVQVTNLVTAEQLKVLEVRYGDAVRAVQTVSTP